MKRNSVHIEGHVKRDADCVRTENGDNFLQFTLVVDGGMREPPTYVDCVAFRDVADTVDGYVSTNERLVVDGYLAFRTLTFPKTGRTTRLCVAAESIVATEE